MSDDRLTVTDSDVRDQNLLLRFLRKVLARLRELADRITNIEKTPPAPSFAMISRELQSTGSAPLNLTQLPGVTREPQPARVPRLSAAPTGQLLQQYIDQQLIAVGTTPNFDLYTIVGGNPSTAVKITPSGAAHNFLSATHTDTVAGTPALGDILYSNATPAWTKLAGNIAAATYFMSQTGTGAVSAAPIWFNLYASTNTWTGGSNFSGGCDVTDGNFKLKGQRVTAGSLRITNTAGTIQHAWYADFGSNNASPFLTRLNSPSTALANTPSVAAGVGFTNAGGIDASFTAAFLFDTSSDQTDGDMIIIPVIAFNSSGTAVLVDAYSNNVNINGTTRRRPNLWFTNATSGANFNITVANIAAGKSLVVRFIAYLT